MIDDIPFLDYFVSKNIYTGSESPTGRAFDEKRMNYCVYAKDGALVTEIWRGIYEKSRSELEQTHQEELTEEGILATKKFLHTLVSKI